MAGITKQEYNWFRFMKFLNDCGRRVLYKTLCWGTPDKPANIKLHDYLGNLGKPGNFNRIQKEMIDKSPDGSEFDVSLLFLSIKLACKNVAMFNDPKWCTPSAEMEYYVTAIKNMRNNAHHGPHYITDKEFFLMTTNLRELLTNCLKASGKRYGRDEAEINKEIKQVEDDLDNIKQEILGEDDLMINYRDEIQQLMIENTGKTLRKLYQNIIFINPVPFIAEDLRLEVDKIFVDIEVEQGKRRGEGKPIDYRDLIKIAQSPAAHPSTNSASQQWRVSSQPHVILLEGVAGSGKTSLVTMVTHGWVKEGQGKIKGLDNYDLMLWVQCRDSTIHSYQGLLDRLMPDESLKFRNLLPRLMKFCKLLILVDGIDELNENSKKIVNSLIHEFKNSSHTTFICTSRPEQIEVFKTTIPQEYDVTHVELRGILKDRILEFVRLNHLVIKQQTMSERSTEHLVKAVAKLIDLQEYLSLPMNLILLVYIWDQAPDELDMATITQTELYNKIHHLCQRKLLERLANNAQVNVMSRDGLLDRIQAVLKEIYRRALESLSRDQLVFDTEIINQIKRVCKYEGLPHEELLSAFLSLKPTWTWEGVQEQYTVPHKGIQDYYSAKHIVTTLKSQLQSPPLSVSYSHLPTPPLSVSYSHLPTPPRYPPTCALASPPPASPPPASPPPASPPPASPPPASPPPASPPPASPPPASPPPASPPPASPPPASPSSASPPPASPPPASPPPSSPPPASPPPASPPPASPPPASPPPASPSSASPPPASPPPASPPPASPPPASPPPASPPPASSTLAQPGNIRGDVKPFMIKVKKRLESPSLPGMTPVQPGMTPVQPGMTPVQPGMTPVQPGMTPVQPGIIRRVLKQTITPSEVIMTKYQNVLVHVAGLLIMEQVPQAAALEVVDLLQESGMTDEDQWLDLLENTKVTPVTAKAVAPFVNTGGDIYIHDNRVGSYAALLPHLKPSRVRIDIRSDPADLPRLPGLLTGLARHHCLDLRLKHHYRHDDTAASDHILQRLQPRSELKEFKGCLSGDGLAALPPSLEQLSLALVDDDQARNLLPRLHAAVTSRLPRLWLLEVRVAARVTPAALVPLPRPQQVTPAAPGTRGVWLELSDVSDAGVSRACHVASLLQPPGGYGTISYPGATMTAAGCEDMIRDLRHHRVKVEQFVVPRAIPLSDHQLDHLITLARTMRGSYFWRIANFT